MPTMTDTHRTLTGGVSLEPVYVRHGTEQLAAILTVPAHPRGLVALLQGFGATRSHRNRLWTWISTDLAGRGIASVRFDYPGMGDSTGEPGWDLSTPPTEAAARVVDVACRMLGANEYEVAGNCIGARMGLAIGAADPRRTSVAVVLPGTLDGVLDPEPPGSGVDRIATALQPAPLLARAVRGLARRRAEHRVRLAPDIGVVLARKPVFFFFLGRPQMWADLNQAVRRVAERAGPEAARRAFRTYVT